MRFHPCAISLLIMLCFASPTIAHPGHDSSNVESTQSGRTWTDASGQFTVQAGFVMAKDDRVQLRRTDGTVITLPISRLSQADRTWIAKRQAAVERLNSVYNTSNKTSDNPNRPAAAKHFQAFDNVNVRWDDTYLYIESDGIPDHPMMIGITAWQQQVPIPQPYTGDNAWRIPLRPVPAKEPMSAKTNFFRGAIAIAVNGIPIFNPIKNDGKTDTALAGELDRYGGHSGRADDYHYHIAPTHLQDQVGKGNPVAYALDGYAIYGYQDPDQTKPLDWLNGHQDSDGTYHYHATKTYPYLNGGFRGEVVQQDGQVHPQPRARPIRPWLQPLKGAKITDFDHPTDDRFIITYEVGGQEHQVNYLVADDRSATFNFVSPTGTRTETYRPGSPRDQSDRPNKPTKPKGKDKGKGKKNKGPRGPQAGDGPRQPWIVVHADEVDINQDRVISRDEIVGEATKAFTGYDRNADNQLDATELSTGSKVPSAMGGFIRGHATEIDRDGDGLVSKDEAVRNAERMFGKIDADQDGSITQAELNAARRTKDNANHTPPAAQPSRPQTNSATPQPIPSGDSPLNFIFILIDDMGWRDVGFAGNTFVETPTIDRLARDGIIFSQAYSSAPNCAPTRACLLTGQYAPRHGVYTVVDSRNDPGKPYHRVIAATSNAQLSDESVTIAEALKPHGYATAMFGMWNLGRGRTGPGSPNGQGFDIHKRPQDLGFEKDTYLDPNGRYLTDALVDEGIGFMESNADRPFFLYLPLHAIHAPFEPKPSLLRKYESKAAQQDTSGTDPVYAAMIESVDLNVTRIMNTLKQLNITDNTMIIFTSDNGGTPQHVAPLNGSKGALYEGGIRVPACVWWNGIQNPGRVSDEPIVSMDFYPTMLAAARISPPPSHPIDGISLLPLLTGTGPLRRDAVFWHFPCYTGRAKPASAVRIGEYKLIQHFEDGRLELFNLTNDIGEKNNLASTDPDRADRMFAVLSDWQQRLNAPLPSKANPEFDPSAKREKGRRNRK